MEDPMHLVFEQELLRERILNYVMHDKSGEISVEDVKSCRLVNRDWMQSVSKCFRKSEKPLFRLLLKKENSINGSNYVTQNGKLLDNFVSAVTGASRLEQEVPPFKIIATVCFFRQENQQSFYECLNRCGRSLVDLEIYFPSDGGSMAFVFRKLSFPRLTRCVVMFSEVHNRSYAVGEKALGNIHCTYLMQQIFYGCERLREMILRKIHYQGDLFPHSFEQLELPITITTLDLCFFLLENKHLDLITKNTFLNLEHLYLRILETSLANGLILKVLERIQATLSSFIARGNYLLSSLVREREGRVTFFQLPLLRKLKTFESDSIILELEPGVSRLESMLPSLLKLSLENQTVQMFHKWTENTELVSVNELVVSLAEINRQENRTSLNALNYLSFRLDMMQRVAMAFPNLQILEVTVCGTELCGLQFAFGHMNRLRVLKVNARKSESIVNSDYWDATLIGIPVELATALRTTAFWNQIAEFKNESIPSIKDLTELKELVLKTKRSPRTAPQETGALISDAVFQFAFHRMPKLTKLEFGGRFMASPEAKKEWKSKGGLIVYTK